MITDDDGREIAKATMTYYYPEQVFRDNCELYVY